MFCPECGKELKPETKYKKGSFRGQFLSCGSHLWEIWPDATKYYGGKWEFNEVKMATCDCGETSPQRDMHDIDDNRQGNKPTHKHVCDKCYNAACKAWRMDPEKSFARMDITPVKTAERFYYLINTAINIRPYPNPFMYGGCYGGGSAMDEQNLEQQIKSFTEQADRLRENGMVKIEIVRHDEKVRTEQIDLVKTETPSIPEKHSEHDDEPGIEDEVLAQEEPEADPVQAAFTGLAESKRIHKKALVTQGALMLVD